MVKRPKTAVRLSQLIAIDRARGVWTLVTQGATQMEGLVAPCAL